MAAGAGGYGRLGGQLGAGEGAGAVTLMETGISWAERNKCDMAGTVEKWK